LTLLEPHITQVGQRDGAAAVYFPACINRIFGRAPGQDAEPSLPAALVGVSARAGKPLWIPDGVRGLCCATPWASKGYIRGHEWMAAAVADAMWDWSERGVLPIVVDAVSCTHGLIEDVGSHLDDERRSRFEQIHLIDAIEWTHSLLPHLSIQGKRSRALVHPTCSTLHLGLEEKLVELANAVADEVVVPMGTTCCGTAGIAVCFIRSSCGPRREKRPRMRPSIRRTCISPQTEPVRWACSTPPAVPTSRSCSSSRH
jgi:D-lactate dehydrogenase